MVNSDLKLSNFMLLRGKDVIQSRLSLRANWVCCLCNKRISYSHRHVHNKATVMRAQTLPTTRAVVSPLSLYCAHVTHSEGKESANFRCLSYSHRFSPSTGVRMNQNISLSSSTEHAHYQQTFSFGTVRAPYFTRLRYRFVIVFENIRIPLSTRRRIRSVFKKKSIYGELIRKVADSSTLSSYIFTLILV